MKVAYSGYILATGETNLKVDAGLVAVIVDSSPNFNSSEFYLEDLEAVGDTIFFGGGFS
jgi:predicted metal-dependent RNase